MERSDSRDGRARTPERAVSFTDVYDVHVEEVYRFVHRRCRDHALSEDITQETFMTAIRSTGDPSSISIGWLLTVARNRLVDVVRRQTRYERKLRVVGVDDVEDRPDEVVDRLAVEGALSELTQEHRLVLTLHYIDGLTVPAMAAELDRSVKSIEGLVTRARRELRATLDLSDESDRGSSHG